MALKVPAHRKAGSAPPWFVTGRMCAHPSGDISAAEAQVRAIRPDLAMVDVMLPGINGLEGVLRFKALSPGLLRIRSWRSPE